MALYEDRQDPAAQLLVQLAVNERMKSNIRDALAVLERYGGGNGAEICQSVKRILWKILYES